MGIPADEMERARSVRLRSLRTEEVIWQNHELLLNLEDAGIPRSDTPKVLTALGIDIDVDVAAELVNNPGVPSDKLEEELPARTSMDRLSVLYVGGKLHGIEPDYQWALGVTMLEQILELRSNLAPGVPPRRIAELLAVIETTKLAVAAREITTISLRDYERFASAEALRLGTNNLQPDVRWPVPALILRHRFGHGAWENVLRDAGMRLHEPGDRLEEDAVYLALDAFAEECINFERLLDIETYDRWVYADASFRQERPSASEVIRAYGSWRAAVEAIMPPLGNSDEDTTADGDALFDGQFLSGEDIVHLEVIEEADRQEAEGWQRAGELIGELLAITPWNSFIQIQYGETLDDRTQPYAQATPSADGVWCEVVSEHFLPAADWPINRNYLSESAWQPPDDEVPNWRRTQVPLSEAGHVLLAGLRFGRGCHDAGKLQWSTGEFPPGPRPDGGVTAADVLAGAVQTLRNAG
ncbi:TY-Chap domain-containing protein [Arthrobacter zhaoguopingii]|uniref:TY-Chap domain-containing protein n=1 Tax=Arthrobacter zhaoguopingii TaxID=2681491 RepID=UPI001358420D|nr:hypothetical protein [Arthrobacter zhaoguopingii]